jgi:hypothetical protein
LASAPIYLPSSSSNFLFFIRITMNAGHLPFARKLYAAAKRGHRSATNGNPYGSPSSRTAAA